MARVVRIAGVKDKIAVFKTPHKVGTGAASPVTLADADAPDDSIYYSSDQSKLVYKDSSSVVHDLY